MTLILLSESFAWLIEMNIKEGKLHLVLGYQRRRSEEIEDIL